MIIFSRSRVLIGLLTVKLVSASFLFNLSALENENNKIAFPVISSSSTYESNRLIGAKRPIEEGEEKEDKEQKISSTTTATVKNSQKISKI